jgi:hypothetical protein
MRRARAEGSLTDGEAASLPFWAGQGRLRDRSAPLLRANANHTRRKGESGHGIQALRLADAPGEEGSPFAPTRSDCRHATRGP